MMRKLFLFYAFFFVSLTYAIVVEWVTPAEFVKVIEDWKPEVDEFRKYYCEMSVEERGSISTRTNKYALNFEDLFKELYKGRYAKFVNTKKKLNDVFLLVALNKARKPNEDIDGSMVEGIMFAERIHQNGGLHCFVNYLLTHPKNILPYQIWQKPVSGVGRALFGEIYNFARDDGMDMVSLFPADFTSEFYRKVIPGHVPCNLGGEEIIPFSKEECFWHFDKESKQKEIDLMEIDWVGGEVTEDPEDAYPAPENIEVENNLPNVQAGTWQRWLGAAYSRLSKIWTMVSLKVYW